MAAEMMGVDMVTILVDDIELQVPKGELIVESVKRLGIEIPIFCYHPRMKPVGMCRMCLVETGTKQPDGTIRKMPKPQASCTLPASEGLAIYTQTPQIIQDRKGVLEFLLINHPLDCPICDRGGECPLQNNTLFYGPSTSRHIEFKRHAPKAIPLSEHVTLDLERCIQCGRCVRFTEEISGDGQLAFRFRGASMQPSTFALSAFESKFSGNTIEICPVGALTSSQSRFRARPWDLESSAGVCTLCSCGCNVWFDHRIGKLVRVNGRTNNAVNEEWTCDQGKFGHDYYNHNERQASVFIRTSARLESTSWTVGLGEIVTKLKSTGTSAGFLLGPKISNEAGFLACRAATALGSRQVAGIDSRVELGANFEVPADSLLSLEQAKVIVSVGPSLADTLPIVYLRVRKAASQKGAKVISIHSSPTELDEFAFLSLCHKPGTLSLLIQGLDGSLALEEVALQTGVSAQALKEAKTVLEGQGVSFIATNQVAHTEGSAALSDLRRLAKKLEANWNHFCETASGFASLASCSGLGMELQSPESILKKCLSGDIKFLWLVDFDPFELVKDRELVKQALEEVEFLVVQSAIASEASHYASVVLPQSLPAEGGGSFTNLDGQLQNFDAFLPKIGMARADWQIFAELLSRMDLAAGMFSRQDILQMAAKDVPYFKEALTGKQDHQPQPSGAGV